MTALRPRPGRIVPRVRLLFDASLRDRCSERSCCLGLRGISRHVVLRGESVAHGRKMCDCIVLHDAAVPRIVFVELKSGLFHIGQVLEKFTNAWTGFPARKSRFSARRLSSHSPAVAQAAHLEDVPFHPAQPPLQAGGQEALAPGATLRRAARHPVRKNGPAVRVDMQWCPPRRRWALDATICVPRDRPRCLHGPPLARRRLSRSRAEEPQGEARHCQAALSTPCRDVRRPLRPEPDC